MTHTEDPHAGDAIRDFRRSLIELCMRHRDQWENRQGKTSDGPVAAGKLATAIFDTRIELGHDVLLQATYGRYTRELLYANPPELRDATVTDILNALDIPDGERVEVYQKLAIAKRKLEEQSRPSKVGTINVTPSQTELFHDLVMRFYTDPLLTTARVELENHYLTTIDPIIQQYLLDDGAGNTIELSPRHAKVDGRLTNYLNFLEYLLHCLRTGAIIQDQLDDLFDYWLNRLFTHPRYAALRVYLPLWDYELLAARYKQSVSRADLSRKCVAVYGTLLHGQAASWRMHEVQGRSRYVRSGQVAGRLYEVSPEVSDPTFDQTYPCLVHDLGGRPVAVEIYEVLDSTLWSELDKFECFDPSADDNEYIRRVTALDVDVNEGLDAAWVYHYVGAQPDVERYISNGDWREFTSSKA